MARRLFARSARLVRGVLFVFQADVLEDVGVRGVAIGAKRCNRAAANLQIRKRRS